MNTGALVTFPVLLNCSLSSLLKLTAGLPISVARIGIGSRGRAPTRSEKPIGLPNCHPEGVVRQRDWRQLHAIMMPSRPHSGAGVVVLTWRTVAVKSPVVV